MDRPFIPYDRDDSPEPETPIDVDKNPPPQTSKILREPDGTEVETPVPDAPQPDTTDVPAKKKRGNRAKKDTTNKIL